MSETKTTKNNTVHVVGYLKENNLEVVKFKNKKTGADEEAIRGSITVAVNEVSSYKVQFFMNQKTKDGTDSKDYAKLAELLPNNTISIAGYLKANDKADFNVAANAAAKVYVMAHFEEFASRVGEREKSMVSLKGFRAGFMKAESGTFTPCADFTVDVYINKLERESDTEGKDTGRVLLEGIIPTYDGKSASKIDFVAYPDDNIAKYVIDNYHVTDTVTLKGDVINTAVRKLVSGSGADSDFFGRGNAPQYETTFVRERKIMGGSKNSLKSGDEGSFTVAFIKQAMAGRDIKMDENGKRKLESKPSSTPTGFDSVDKATSKLDEVDF